MMYKFFLKEILDRMVAFILLIFFLPILLLVSLVSCINFGSNPFFFQSRPGKNNKSFNLIKFKTMVDDENNLPDINRITRYGSFLRKYSIDELPELFNILKGDMSFIGPRPLLDKYLSRYSEFQLQRHNVKPGLTGLAQVNGRNQISWKNRFRYDVFYVKNVSAKLDMKILFDTFKVVFTGRGVNASNKEPMSEFMGNNNN